MTCTCCCCACISETNFAIVERWGKFSRILSPGCTCLSWPCESVSGEVSTRLQQIILKDESKTKDNVFVEMRIAVQYLVHPDMVKTAHYSMQNPLAQITSFVENSLRAISPTMELDQLFAEKDRVAREIKADLAAKMESLGYTIVDTLIVDIEPEGQVKSAMNRINQAKRVREAAEYEAETEKLVLVKRAEAEAQSKKLQGEGVAAQRKAILHGMQESVEDLAAAMHMPSDELLKYTMMTQYFDMLRDVGTSDNKTTIFIPHGPGAVGSVIEQVRQGMMESYPVGKSMDK